MYKTSLRSQDKINFDTNKPSLIDGDCDVIATVDKLLGDSTFKVAVANPDQLFAITDFAYDLPQCEAKRCA